MVFTNIQAFSRFSLLIIALSSFSAILCAANPEIYPFMADEVMEVIPGFKREYTAGAYFKMQSEIGKKAETLTKGKMDKLFL